MLATNSRVALTLSSVSLGGLRCMGQNMTMGGSPQMALKKVKGARLTTPAAEGLETPAHLRPGSPVGGPDSHGVTVSRVGGVGREGNWKVVDREGEGGEASGVIALCPFQSVSREQAARQQRWKAP